MQEICRPLLPRVRLSISRLLGSANFSYSNELSELAKANYHRDMETQADRSYCSKRDANHTRP